MRSQTSMARPRVEPLEDRTLMSTCHVTRLTDQGIGKGFRGDLRYCINKVNAEPGPDAIDFTVTGTIQTLSTLPTLESEIDIHGPGAALLNLKGIDNFFSQDHRVFHVSHAAVARISGVTVSNGQSHSNDPLPDGGGILNLGNLTLDHVVVTGNTAFGGFYDAKGGGIYNGGTLSVSYSTISNNLADHSGDSGDTDALGGGVYNAGIMTIRHSTISGNRSWSDYEDSQGGGIYNLGTLEIQNSTIGGNALDENFGSRSYGGGIINRGEVSIFHSTVTANTAKVGGGIHGDIKEMRNTIIANNTASESNPDISGNLAASGNNLIGDSDGGSGYAPSDLLDVDPLLGQLADNGGPTLTIAFQPGSPAIDAGDNTNAPEWDQRGPGFPRIVNGTIDIGAFEVQAAPIPSGVGVGRPTPSATAPIPYWTVLLTADWLEES